MRVGYVRCSTVEQNEARQLKMMEEQKVEKIFIDKASGKNVDRKDFKAMMAFVRAGDTVIVESISRIARNTRDLLTIISSLTEKGVKFVSLKENIDTTTSHYQLDIDNAAIYYLFDRDPASNTDKTFIQDMLSKLASACDINEDMERQGMLLLSYPCIESFVGMNLLSNSIDYCWRKTVSIGDDLKKSLQQDGLIPNKISEQTLIHCADELISSLSLIGVETTKDAFQASMDHFADTNTCVYEWQEQQYSIRNQYGLLSLFIMALIDLGLISIVQDE